MTVATRNMASLASWSSVASGALRLTAAPSGLSSRHLDVLASCVPSDGMRFLNRSRLVDTAGRWGLSSWWPVLAFRGVGAGVRVVAGVRAGVGAVVGVAESVGSAVGSDTGDGAVDRVGVGVSGVAARRLAAGVRRTASGHRFGSVASRCTSLEVVRSWLVSGVLGPSGGGPHAASAAVATVAVVSMRATAQALGESLGHGVRTRCGFPVILAAPCSGTTRSVRRRAEF